MVEIHDLHVRFHGASREAVAGIDLTIRDGEVVGLVGESGSGKTVTAMTLSGLIERKKVTLSGEVRFDGRDILRLPRAELRAIQGRELGVVFQEPMTAMDPLMRIGPQVEEALAVHTQLTKEQRRARALEALRDVDLPAPEEIYRKYPHECSGGQLQRVMIAAAIVTDPHLLLLDEPTTALDVTVQAQILALLRRLNRERGISMLLISHNLQVVRRICSRVAVMQRGHIVEEGAPEQLFTAPQHPYTAELINSAWQKEFSLFFSVEEVEPEEFQKRLENGSYTIALAPVQAEGGSVYTALAQFSPTGGGLTGYSDALYTTQLSASATATGSTRCSLLAACERQLLEQAVAVPLFTQQKRLLVANGIEGLVFDPFGPVLDVTYATKS